MSNPSPWLDPILVGGSGGNPLNARGLDPHRFALVKRLEMWWDDVRVRGMRITFSDDVVTFCGGTDKNLNYKAITFDMNGTAADPGPERVTEMWMQKSSDGARLGRVHIETSRGQKWEDGPVNGKDRVEIPVGTGVFVGLDVRCGADIDAAGPLFLRSSVAKIALGEITYTPDPRGLTTGISPVTINEARSVNLAGAPKPFIWTFSGSDKRTITSSHEMTTTNPLAGNVSVEVSGDVFSVVAKAGGGFEWASKKGQTTGPSTSEDIQFDWSANGQLQPGQAIMCNTVVQHGMLVLSFSATVTVTFKDGTKFEYVGSGSFKTATYSEMRTTVEPESPL